MKCPATVGWQARLGGRPRMVSADVNHDVDDPPPSWAVPAVARRRAVRALRLRAQADGADGVVGIVFAHGPDGGPVTATGTAVRRRRAPVPRGSADEAFTTHLPLAAADLAVEAGMVPRRLVVTACRAALHDPFDEYPERARETAATGTLDQLVWGVHELAARTLSAAGRRRGPATVSVADVVIGSGAGRCPSGPEDDVWVTLLALSTVLAGAVDRSPAATDLAASLARLTVPVGLP